MEPVVRRSDFVLMLCPECRISVSVEPPSCNSLDFPLPCPQCNGVAGVPQRVSTRPHGGVTVTVKCERCAHEWTCTISRPDSRSSFPAARSPR